MARKSPMLTGIPCCFICHYFPDSIGKYQQEFQAHLEVTCKKKSLEANVSARKPPIPTQGSAQEIHQSPHHLLLHSIFQNCLCDCPQFLCLRRQLVQSFTIMLVAPEETKIILSMIFCHNFLYDSSLLPFCMTASLYSEQPRCFLLQESSAITLSSPLHYPTYSHRTSYKKKDQPTTSCAQPKAKRAPRTQAGREAVSDPCLQLYQA